MRVRDLCHGERVKHEITNLCPADLSEVSDFARRRLKSMQRRPKLIRAFWQQTELAL